MELYGDNSAFGVEQVELSDKRRVLPIEAEAPEFPLGVGGLLPVLTARKGGEKTVYAFATTSAAEETEAGEAATGEAEAEGTSPDVAVPNNASSPAQRTRKALEEAVDCVNRMLGLAAKFSGYPFGRIGGIEVGIAAEGTGFTRVAVVELDAHGKPSASPLHLHIETTDEPGCPDSFSAMLEYDKQGKPVRVVMTEYGEEGVSVRADATVNEKSGKLSVRKVEHIDAKRHTKDLLYKRGYEPGQSGERRGGGREDRWDRDRRGGRNDRDDWGRGWRRDDDRRGGGRAGDWDRRDDRRSGSRDDWRGERRGGDWGRGGRDDDRRGGRSDRFDRGRDGRGGRDGGRGFGGNRGFSSRGGDRGRRS